MARGSAELSEFAPTKFEPMIDAGAAKLSAVLISCKHLAMTHPQCIPQISSDRLAAGALEIAWLGYS